ncbi:hypothetical protein NW762_013651 [Fusarium torreyae]|uniref:ATPase AAA-type core domain-containing protein n=1 Tax=Fusarium torreyae TaxID=1237075 RepID=A0A9W8RLX0_9HYPO|nr:hypothetical protein NW762_013651 [Fusarium torreyae]
MTTPAECQNEIPPLAAPSPLAEDISSSKLPGAEYGISAAGQDDGLAISPDQAMEQHGLNSPDPGENQAEVHFEDPAASVSQKMIEPSSSLVSEIHDLRDKVLFLEAKVLDERGTVPEDLKYGRMKRFDLPEDESKFRNQIRRARAAKKWVEKTEKNANETQNNRGLYGISRFGASYLEDVTESGQEEFIQGVRFQTGREEDLYYHAKVDGSAHPDRGMRPPTALRPIYSRKLGPPTQWDTSDSEEWSSDGSSRSRDFDYFRARLRGDFEWELDRLNAQKSRYEKHKEKKSQAAQEHGKAQEADDDSTEEVYAENPAVQPKLMPVEWATFKASRKTVAGFSCVIDILVGEPQISNSVFNYYGEGRFNTKVVPLRSRVLEGDQIHKVETTGQGSAHSVSSHGQVPLPERIRIHSKELIKTLSIIHGSEIGPSESTAYASVVMLRPFRMLTYYESEIRKWHSKLTKKFQKTNAVLIDTETMDRPLNFNAEERADDEQEDPSSNPEEPSGVPDPEGCSRSETALEHLTCLLEFMDHYILKKLVYLDSPSCERIFFSDIWHLFKPGDHVISADGKQVYQVFSLACPPHVGTDPWSKFVKKQEDSDDESDKVKEDITIQCVFIHFDGSQIGPVLKTFSIAKFDGEKAITALDIYPLRFHVRKQLDRDIMKLKQSKDEIDVAVTKGVDRLQQSLTERGKLFIEVAAVKHMYYAGLTVGSRDEVQSQVMIDFEEAFTVEQNENWRPEVVHLVGATSFEGSSENAKTCEAECCVAEIVHGDSYVERKRHQDFMKGMMRRVEDGLDDMPPATVYPRPLETLNAGESKLTRDELLIMSYCVFGFVLRDRSWAQLDLTYLTHVTDPSDGTTPAVADGSQDDRTAFGRLVLPRGHKDMVLSLISQHFRNKVMQEDRDRDEQVDIVRGKEGVAEKFKKPLFQITCGDLGSNAKDVEAALQTNFALANRWGCILLLDEADVFLAERRRDDFNRNGLVAVFLRVLEYYAGILFLTTNRIGDFDEAFASRIHMSLHYPPLDWVSTHKILELNLRMIAERYKEAGRKIEIEELEILRVIGEYWQKNEKARWNGRQIRNACQTALALAEFDAQPEDSKYDLRARSDAKVHLKVENIRIVSDAYLEFMEYLKAVHGTDAETHANEAGLRALETAYLAMRSGKTLRGTVSGQTPEGRQNALHKFKLQSPQQQVQTTPMRPEQGYHTPPPHRRVSSQESMQSSMGSYNTHPRMVHSQSGIPMYGQAPTMPMSNYPQYPDPMQASEQYHHAGVQQHLSVPQERSFTPSPAPAGTGPQYRPSSGGYTTDGTASSTMVSMHEQSSSSHSMAETHISQGSGSVRPWPANVEAGYTGNQPPQQAGDGRHTYPHTGNPL